MGMLAELQGVSSNAKGKVMKTRISAGVIKYSYSSSCYNAYALTHRPRMRIVRRVYRPRLHLWSTLTKCNALDMPGMSVPTYAEWLKTKMAEESFAVTSNTAEDEPNKQDRMRQWLNYGINTPDDEPSSKQEQSLARSRALWAMSAHYKIARS